MTCPQEWMDCSPPLACYGTWRRPRRHVNRTVSQSLLPVGDDVATFRIDARCGRAGPTDQGASHVQCPPRSSGHGVGQPGRQPFLPGWNKCPSIAPSARVEGGSSPDGPVRRIACVRPDLGSGAQVPTRTATLAEPHFRIVSRQVKRSPSAARNLRGVGAGASALPPPGGSAGRLIGRGSTPRATTTRRSGGDVEPRLPGAALQSKAHVVPVRRY